MLQCVYYVSEFCSSDQIGRVHPQTSRFSSSAFHCATFRFSVSSGFDLPTRIHHPKSKSENRKISSSLVRHQNQNQRRAQSSPLNSQNGYGYGLKRSVRRIGTALSLGGLARNQSLFSPQIDSADPREIMSWLKTPRCDLRHAFGIKRIFSTVRTPRVGRAQHFNAVA